MNTRTGVQQLKRWRPGPASVEPQADFSAELQTLPMTFEDFYQNEYRSVLGLAYIFTGTQGAAEDLTQEAFTETHRRWETVQTYDHPEAWVRRVLVNKKTSRLRRLSTETKTNTKLGLQRQTDAELSPNSQEVWAAVRALPQRQAQAVALRYWNDMSVAQIAETLGCGTETVKTHLSRARSTLSQKLDAADHVDTSTQSEGDQQ